MVQGMAFVAGVILMYLPEEPAFRVLCQLLDGSGQLANWYLGLEDWIIANPRIQLQHKGKCLVDWFLKAMPNVLQEPLAFVAQILYGLPNKDSAMVAALHMLDLSLLPLTKSLVCLSHPREITLTLSFWIS